MAIAASDREKLIREKELRRIRKQERQKWFRYYSILRNNQLVSVLTLLEMQVFLASKYKLTLESIAALIVIQLYGGKNVTYKQLYTGLQPSKKATWTIEKHLQRLSANKMITRANGKRGGAINITRTGQNTLKAIEAKFNTTFRFIDENVPDIE